MNARNRSRSARRFLTLDSLAAVVCLVLSLHLVDSLALTRSSAPEELLGGTIPQRRASPGASPRSTWSASAPVSS